MRLIWTATAREDRTRIARAIANDDLTAALKLDAAIEKAANGLPIHPHKGRKGRTDGTRELVVHPNYLLIYQVEDDVVRILTVLHAARRWP